MLGYLITLVVAEGEVGTDDSVFVDELGEAGEQVQAGFVLALDPGNGHLVR